VGEIGGAWDWQKEDIEEYLDELYGREVKEVIQNSGGPSEILTNEQLLEFKDAIFKLFEKYIDLKNTL
jgi:hypothetical protein